MNVETWRNRYYFMWCMKKMSLRRMDLQIQLFELSPREVTFARAAQVPLVGWFACNVAHRSRFCSKLKKWRNYWMIINSQDHNTERHGLDKPKEYWNRLISTIRCIQSNLQTRLSIGWADPFMSSELKPWTSHPINWNAQRRIYIHQT